MLTPERRISTAISGKYGKLQIPKIGDDEPVFILRAQDLLANQVMQVYQLFAASHTRPIAQSLDREIKAFQDWRRTNL